MYEPEMISGNCPTCGFPALAYRGCIGNDCYARCFPDDLIQDKDEAMKLRAAWPEESRKRREAWIQGIADVFSNIITERWERALKACNE